MRTSRVLVVMAALALASAVIALPVQVAGAQPPSTQVLLPANGVTVSGAKVVLDASASSGVTRVQFEVTGGSLSDSVIATATPTIYGWIAEWNSTTVADGPYTLQSIATSGSSSGTSSGLSITVSNGEPSVSIVLPSSGSTLTGSQWLDATASAGVTQVGFDALSSQGHCPEAEPEGQTLCPIGDATPTIYGWLINWDTNDVPNGSYTLIAAARYPNGTLSSPALIGIFVANPGP
jgi:Bacterial Ig domain